ncbi:hypothetical protein PV516_01390 [Streptomyces scabiei]|jgi:hypothetical protein|uniref:hypothetical protein n=1 Tax=Streptomyces scabiei TaxID=1930 RepID=UPI001B304067|nr:MULTISPECIES: hypothetical protein [Streptomyces]MDX3162455.1 hypothetical protein [Streptomyces scabiei]MDX3196403.1 hypothetical protein [Streptomyces scabiei]MDX3217768.1 hypothetical protein [Streptomyces scabiei]QTU64205.1 hypothetical protein F3K22_27190 [Streptomyces sp. LBUM 1475]
MPTDLHCRGSVRSAADLNNRIRALMLGAGGYLRPHERAEYEQLVTAWAHADAAERHRPTYAEAA